MFTYGYLLRRIGKPPD